MHDELLSPGAPARGRTRADFLRGGMVAGGGLVVAGVLLGELPGDAASKPSQKQDAEILNFVLRLEYLQAAFYEEAVSGGALDGELLEFATVVGRHERRHTAAIEDALGGAAAPSPTFDFGDTTASRDAFLRTASQLEDLAVGAYNAGAPNLTRKALTAAAEIVSVEARHAAWIRDIAGKNPAPEASEPVATTDEISAAVRDTGFIQ
jgi:hypothetical protein